MMVERFWALVTADVAAALDGRERAELLEVGPGSGSLAVWIARRLPGARLTGIDISASMVARANDRAARAGVAGRVRFDTGDATALPFPHASFDVVVSTSSVHHWADAPRGFAEIRRVLRPGGRALVYDLPDGITRFHGGARPLAEVAAKGGWPGAVPQRVPWPWRFLSVFRRLELVRPE